MTETGAIQPERLRKLLTGLVDIYSPSGKEGEVIDFLHGYLKRRGLPVRRLKVEERRHNLIVTTPEEAPTVALVGHLDTVSAWDLDDYGPWEEGGRLHGLGAADMKGGCAAMVEAMVSLAEAGAWSPAVALCLVVGEEEEGDGAARLLEELRFPWAIVGEPSNLVPCLSHDGYVEIEVTTRGRRRHAALASEGHNAIGTMLRVMLALSRHLDQERSELVYNVRDLSSSSSGFVVPERCDACLDLHLPPGFAVGEVIAELEEVADRALPEEAPVELSFRVLTVDAGYALAHKGPLVEALEATYGRLGLAWAPGEFRSHSDANQLWSAGVRPVLLGPGRLEDAHIPDESVSIADVERAAQIYHAVARHPAVISGG